MLASTAFHSSVTKRLAMWHIASNLDHTRPWSLIQQRLIGPKSVLQCICVSVKVIQTTLNANIMGHILGRIVKRH